MMATNPVQTLWLSNEYDEGSYRATNNSSAILFCIVLLVSSLTLLYRVCVTLVKQNKVMKAKEEKRQIEYNRKRKQNYNGQQRQPITALTTKTVTAAAE